MSAILTGPNLFWLLFCYDFFLLIHKKALPNELIQRIKDRQYFQGARYELAVAAIFLRAGFEIQWINKDAAKGKACEFIATHKKTGIKVEVEAKSKKRSGVLHESIGPDSKQGIPNLLRDALKKKGTANIPMIIFIDGNLPFTPGSALEKPIFNETKRAIGILPKDKDSFNLLVITNFPYHYDNFDVIAAPHESLFVFPFNNAWLDSNLLADLQNSLNTYSKIPEKI